MGQVEGLLDNNEETTLDTIWTGDLLDRRQDAGFLENFLIGVTDRLRADGKQSSYVINVDGQWGAGKTFFVSRFARQLRLSGYVVAEVNAWRDDHTDDPFIAVLSAIDIAIEPMVRKPGKAATAWEKVKKGAIPVATRVGSGLIKTWVKKRVGEGLEDILEAIPDSGMLEVEQAVNSVAGQVTVEIERIIDQSAEHLIEKFTSQSKAVAGFRERLGAAASAIVEATGGPVFVVVDELDRCRPSYAVALLERVKHLFEVADVVFVFATNTDQLQHSVQGAYGPGFNGFKYLKRFFERTYLLSKPQPQRFLQTLLSEVNAERVRTPLGGPVALLGAAVDAYDMDLREIEQVVSLISATIDAWRHETKIDLVPLTVLAIAFTRHGSISWSEVIETIPVDFQIELGVTRGRHDSPPTMVVLKVKQVILQFQKYGSAIHRAMNMPHNDSAEMNYVREMITPEWNGKAIDSSTPSVQFEMIKLVANAGRLARREATTAR